MHIMNYRYGMCGIWYGGIFMWIIFLLVIGLAVYLIIQSTKSRTSDTNTGKTPMEILKTRYAKGEITKEEYENLKKDLLS